MTLTEAVGWLRINGGDVRRLSDRGDKLARYIINSYCAAMEASRSGNRIDYDRKEKDFISALTDHIHRDLLIDGRAYLRKKYGYKNDEDPIPPTTKLVM